jgi:hypothetical protein
VVLAAITAALHRLLIERGEHVPAFVVSVPFSARRQANAHDLGNQSGVVPLRLPATGAFETRLAEIARITRSAKGTQRGASTAVLGPVFRLLARVGLYQRFISHQRLIHTFVSNLSGPKDQLHLLGCPVIDVIPLSVATGNVTVSFSILSYAGTLTITINADPDTCSDFERLQETLQQEIDALSPTD